MRDFCKPIEGTIDRDESRWPPQALMFSCRGRLSDYAPPPVKRRANMEWMKSPCSWNFRKRGTGTRDGKFGMRKKNPFGLWLINHRKRMQDLMIKSRSHPSGTMTIRSRTGRKISVTRRFRQRIKTDLR